jgi:hypothetical protein
MRPTGPACATAAPGFDTAGPGVGADRAVYRLAGGLLLLAASRQPQAVRAELVLEWTGELYAIADDGERGRLYRICWALLYAGSLALTATLPRNRHAWQATATTSGASRTRPPHHTISDYLHVDYSSGQA